MAVHSEAEVIAAMRAESRALYGRDGCGVIARDVAIRLYEAHRSESEPYYADGTVKSTQRQLAQMARRGLVRKCHDTRGRTYYRVLD